MIETASVPRVTLRALLASAANEATAGNASESAAWIDLGTQLDAEGEPEGVFRFPHAALSGQALITGAAGSGKSQTVGHLLRQLTAAGIPWLAIEPDASEFARLAKGAGVAGGAGQITVLNPADPHAVPLTLNPLEPEPGYPVQAHIDMVRALLTATFDPRDPRDPLPHVLSQALRRVYEASGWDTVTGGAVPGAIAAPGIPTLRQLQRAAVEAAADLGLGGRSQADVRAFVQVRLGSLWGGPAGRFLEGGHPADLSELLRRNVVITFKDVTDAQDKIFLMGALIIRLAEHLRMRERKVETRGWQGVGGLAPGAPGGLALGGPMQDALRHVIVIEKAHRLAPNPREMQENSSAQGNSTAPGSELFAALLGEVRAYREGIMLAGRNPARFSPEVRARAALKIEHRSAEPGVAAVTVAGAAGPIRVRVPQGAPPLEAPPLEAESSRTQERPPPPALRRSPACGRQCCQVRACSLFELRSAELLAGGDQDAWLRIWTDTLIIAVLTRKPLPHVPLPLRRRWHGLDPRLRECLLANVIDRAVAARSAAVVHTYALRRLTVVIAATATRSLAGGTPSGATSSPVSRAGSGPASAAVPEPRTGPAWVIPQLRWLHELDRLGPFHRAAPDLDDIAPPLDFDLPGLPDWPGIQVRHRLRGLRRHPLSMELGPNRLIAASALLGDDDHAAFDADLATAMPGTETGELLRQAARTMERSASGGQASVGANPASRDLPWLEAVLSWPRLFSPEHHWWWPAEDADVRAASDR